MNSVNRNRGRIMRKNDVFFNGTPNDDNDHDNVSFGKNNITLCIGRDSPNYS